MARWWEVAAAMAVGGAIVVAQAQDAAAVLAGVRKALGGEAKLAAVKTIAATGITRVAGADGGTNERPFELSIELPDKYMKRDVLMAMGPTSVYRLLGFNGTSLINEIDSPPMLNSGGGNWVARVQIGPGGGRGPSDEEQAADRTEALLRARQDFARLALGALGASFGGYPVTFTPIGQAQSPDGSADVLEVAGEGGFVARLFIDAQSRLPRLLAWHDQEPFEVRAEGRGRSGQATVTAMFGAGAARRVESLGTEDEGTPARIREARTRRRTVQYGMFYGDYKTIDGVRFPMRLTRTVDGQTVDETVFERVRLNGRIDPKTFTPSR